MAVYWNITICSTGFFLHHKQLEVWVRLKDWCHCGIVFVSFLLKMSCQEVHSLFFPRGRLVTRSSLCCTFFSQNGKKNCTEPFILYVHYFVSQNHSLVVPPVGYQQNNDNSNVIVSVYFLLKRNIAEFLCNLFYVYWPGHKSKQGPGTRAETCRKCLCWKNINLLPISVNCALWQIQALIIMTKII